MHKYIALLVLCLMLLPGGTADGWRARKVEVKVTAYCPCKKCCGRRAKGITATGRSAINTKGIAIDRNVFHHGMRFDIPGYGDWTIADDTGSAIRGQHIDIRFQKHADAVRYGVQYHTVTVWEKR